MRLLAATRHWLRRQPVVIPADPGSFADDHAVFRAPEWGGTGVVAMTTDGGRDQVAAAVVRTGWESFERPLPRLVAVLAADADGAFYDVGANTGFYALLARHVNRDIPVRAFEPYPPVLELLRHNVEVNATAVTVVPTAVGHACYRAELFVPDPRHGLVETSASLDPAFKAGDHAGTVAVDVVTLDAYNAEERDERVAVVKIDVEGCEHRVVEGAARVIARDRPFLVLEVLPSSDLPALEELREQAGYVDVQLHPDGAAIAAHMEFASTSWNHLLVPVEAWPRAERLLARAGLRGKGLALSA